MKNFKKNKILVLFFAALVLAVSCSKNGLCYITDQNETENEDSGEAKSINYFFDRTDSIGGFTQDGKETDYGRAIDSVLTRGETLGYNAEFYEFGERATVKLNLSVISIQKEVKKRSFYGGGYDLQGDKNRQKVMDNDGQPFSSIVQYIKTEKTGAGLNVVVTDLYEQHGINQNFHLFFQDAFNNGLSGAIFAIQSEFKGNIYNISSANDSLYGVNGYSTFFLFIRGNKGQINEYCRALSENLENKKIKFHKTLFLYGESSINEGNRVSPDNKTVTNPNQFNAACEQNFMLNLKAAPQFIKKWRKRGKSFAVSGGEQESYLVLTDTGSQFVYKIKKDKNALIKDSTEAPTELPEIKNFSLEYFDGGKTQPGQPSKFNAASGMIEKPLVRADEDYDYIDIKIRNNKLDKGYYRVRFNIIPDWVEALNGDVAALKASKKPGGLIKVLNLSLIYENILREFNKVSGYSETFYIVKN